MTFAKFSTRNSGHVNSKMVTLTQQTRKTVGLRRDEHSKGIAQLGKCSMGWFFGIKFHIIIKDKVELLKFMITPTNTDDRDPLKNASFVEKVSGKHCGDKGYIDKRLFEFLIPDGV